MLPTRKQQPALKHRYGTAVSVGQNLGPPQALDPYRPLASRVDRFLGFLDSREAERHRLTGGTSAVRRTVLADREGAEDRDDQD